MPTATKSKNISKEWRELLCQLPGYDPFRDAEGYYFDKDEAEHRIKFFRDDLTHVKGALAGEPYELEPHERAMVANLFGWKSETDHTRRYRVVFYYVARGNSKSTLAGGLINCVSFTDEESGAEIYSTAASRDQARLVDDVVRRQIRNNPDMESACKLFQNSVTIFSDDRVYKALAAEAHTAHGLNIHCVVNDELHAHKTRDFLDVIRTAQGKRRQPLEINITTADFERPGSYCNELHDYAKRVRDGIIHDPAFLPAIYEVSKEQLDADPDCWKREEVWRQANPLFGKAVSEDYFRREFQRALESPAYQNEFKRLHLNIRTEQRSLWIPMDKWAASAGNVDDAMEWRMDMLESLKGQSPHAGIDLGSVSDLSALALLFHHDDGYVWIPFFWVPREGAREKERKHVVPYLQWIREGWITATPGDVTDYDYILADVLKLCETYPFVKSKESGEPEIAVDRLFQGIQFCTDLQSEGMEPVAFGQGFMSMAAPTKRLEELIRGGQLRHGNNPVLNWMASNVAVKTDPAGNMKVEKPKREDAAKIDAFPAVIMALGRSMAVGEEQPSAYEHRGVDFWSPESDV